MGIFNFIKNKHIESIDWSEPDKQTIVYAYPLDNRLIKIGAELTVRESQVAVFVSEGKVADVFRPGRYSLYQYNLPILSQLNGWRNGFRSPFKASIFFVNKRLFNDHKWSTANPIAINDAEFGQVRIKASGNYSFKVTDGDLFMKGIFSTNQIYETAYLLGQHKGLITAELSEMIVESQIPVAEMMERRQQLNEFMEERLRSRFARLGLELTTLAIDSITLPAELIAIIEEKARADEEVIKAE